MDRPTFRKMDKFTYEQMDRQRNRKTYEQFDKHTKFGQWPVLLKYYDCK